MTGQNENLAVFEEWIKSIPEKNISQEDGYFSAIYENEIPTEIKKITGVVVYPDKILVWEKTRSAGWACSAGRSSTLEAYKILSAYCEK